MDNIGLSYFFRSVVVILSLFTLSSGYSFDKDFPPYAKGKFPPHCKIHPLKPQSETDRSKAEFKSLYRLVDKGRSVNLHMDMNYQKGTSGMYARFEDSKGKAIVQPAMIGAHPSYIEKVYWAYLNKDGYKDLIIVMDNGDGYLGAGKQLVTFLLSTKQGYRTRQLTAHTLQQEDFYDYSTDNKCEFLHQAFVSDGKDFYWAYNVLQFIDGDIVLKNQLSRYFPKWITFKSEPNDQSAKLSQAQQQKLADIYQKQMGNSLK